jgi:hypothetical protein
MNHDYHLDAEYVCAHDGALPASTRRTQAQGVEPQYLEYDRRHARHHRPHDGFEDLDLSLTEITDNGFWHLRQSVNGARKILHLRAIEAPARFEPCSALQKNEYACDAHR